MNSAAPRSLIEPQERSDLWRVYVGISLSAFLVILGIFQTQLFVSFLPQPDIEAIRRHMAEAQEIQKQIATNYYSQIGKDSIRGTGFRTRLFDVKQSRMLEEALNSLQGDEMLQTELKHKFGISFRDLNVVVIPAWQTYTTDNNYIVGLTDYGWREARAARVESDVGGFTVRDRPLVNPVTIDGTPRIVLNPEAFRSTKALRLTLFHEMFHAMNVPGYYPSRFTFAQTDLTYLPEYRNFVKREQLEEFKEFKLWLLAVFIPALICLLCVRRALALRRTIKAATV